MKKVCKALSLLWVALLVVLMLFPVCYMVVHSLKNIDLIETFYQGVEVIKARLLIEPFYISFEQYYEILFRTPQFLYMFWNAMIIVVPIAILQVVIAVFAAYGFSKLKFWGSDILFFIYIVIMLMPFQVTVVPNYIILECFNLLDKYTAIILPGVWGTFSVFFLKQFMDGIQKEFLEEARILGANEFQILHYENGEMVSEGDVLVEIRAKDIPYCVSFNANNQQASSIVEGMVAEFDIEEKRGEVEVTEKTQNEDGSYTISCQLSEDMIKVLELKETEYKMGLVELINRSSEFDTLIPSSSVIYENGQAYIYIVEREEESLDTSYVAQKVKVSILKEGDHTVAVEGEIPVNAEIVTSYSKELKDGTKIRMK